MKLSLDLRRVICHTGEQIWCNNTHAFLRHRDFNAAMIFIAAPYSVWLWLYDIMDYKKCLYLVSDGTVRRPYELFFSFGVATVTGATHATV